MRLQNFRLTAALCLSLLLAACAARAPGAGGSGLPETRPGVNPFLWRAALEVARPLPLRQASQAEGVIITEWRQLPQKPDERASMVIYILDRQLAAGSLQVEVFRQRRAAGAWEDVPDSRAAAGRIMDAILLQARELRNSVHAGG